MIISCFFWSSHLKLFSFSVVERRPWIHVLVWVVSFNQFFWGSHPNRFFLWNNASGNLIIIGGYYNEGSGSGWLIWCFTSTGPDLNHHIHTFYAFFCTGTKSGGDKNTKNNCLRSPFWLPKCYRQMSYTLLVSYTLAPCFVCLFVSLMLEQIPLLLANIYAFNNCQCTLCSLVIFT